MIKDVPSPTDFAEAGLGYLNLAWDDAVGLYLDAKNWETYREYSEPGYDPVVGHWERAKRRLATCALLVHQGTEFLLKAGITSVSPFLLLDTPENWPGRAAIDDASFSDFRTIDAQHLPKLYDTVSPKRLSNAFKDAFTRMRKRRNTLAHSHGNEVVPQAMEIVRDLLLAVSELHGQGMWPSIRRTYELGHPNVGFDHHGQTIAGLNLEFDAVISELTTSECCSYLGFPRKQRRYYCPSCPQGDLPVKVPLAVLTPKSPGSTALACIACGEVFPVQRTSCNAEGCKGDVLSEDDECLTCGVWNEDSSEE